MTVINNQSNLLINDSEWIRYENDDYDEKLLDKEFI